MRIPKRQEMSLRQKIIMWLGIIFFLAALVFGAMKFADVFSEQAEKPAETQPQTEEEAEPEKKDSKPEESPPKHEQPPKNEVEPEQAGPTEGVGTLSWVVNKKRPLNPKTYIPPNLVTPKVKLRVSGIVLRNDTAAAAEKLFTAAKAAGHNPMISSGYRSYSTQASLYNSYVAQDGQAAADTYSARPGYSEHQTGLAFDICNADACSLVESFGSTSLGKWVASHAHKYGFIVRYPSGKQNITGYTYEPWHLRLVGVETATKIYSSGKTLEEYFGLPAAPTY